jgi:HKD family nuclease
MDLLLHTPDSKSKLSHLYQKAFKNAVELFIVTAYLTAWDASLKLTPKCRRFRLIIGKDFGITRKAACETVMRWLPAKRKGQFMVADRIGGFHPKAVIWTEADKKCFAIIGSSNLTRAAFETNYEANVVCSLTESDYQEGKKWVKVIEKQSVVVSEDWVKNYTEAVSGGGGPKKGSKKTEQDAGPLIAFTLPKPRGMMKIINNRREQIRLYSKNAPKLTKLFRSCAEERISSQQFYADLPKYWSEDMGDRISSKGWERSGKDSDFKALSRSFIRILQATNEDRDDVVVEEIDGLHEKRVPARRAFLSEMLCLMYPKEYPLLNKPVQEYLKKVKFKAPQGASEGVHFLDLARKLRFSLLQNPDHPAKNLAELDAVIWLEADLAARKQRARA